MENRGELGPLFNLNSHFDQTCRSFCILGRLFAAATHKRVLAKMCSKLYEKMASGEVACLQFKAHVTDQARVSQIRDTVMDICQLPHDFIPSLGQPKFVVMSLRSDILDLHERFLCGGNWGLERTYQEWVVRQPWRQCLPCHYFERLGNEFSTFFLETLDSS